MKPVNDDHPSPGAEEKASRRESAIEFRSKLRVVRKRRERPFKATDRALGQAMGPDQSAQIMRRGMGHHDPCHRRL